MATAQPILQIHDLSRVFGGIVAVKDFSLEVYPGSIHGLIGPNGAGKTTTFNVISGFYPPSSGKVIPWLANTPFWIRPEIRFIGGEPINPATNRLAGAS